MDQISKEQIHIGKLNGKILVFGGAYSNLQALEKMKDIAREADIPASNTICTGDIIGYCAQPTECLSVIREWGIHSIAGNVEVQIRNGDEECGCNFEEGTRCDVFSRQWYPYAFNKISDLDKKWMSTLPLNIKFEYAGKQICILHGGLDDISQFIFESTDWSTKDEIIRRTQSNVILAGHCGLPFHNVEDDHHWLNAGVIGMPANDGTSRVWYMILDDEDGFNFSHHSYEYDHIEAAKLMVEESLPTIYAKTLSSGLWDNCEVLPEKETGMQGIPYEF
ncbi:MAG: metallophosphoesterase family protein [Cyclobacteriaceae bacterium]